MRDIKENFMKKKLMAGVLSAIMALSVFAGCGSSENTDLLDTIKERGYITVAMEGTWAPWTYHDESGELVGFDVEVAKAVADKLGVEVRYEEGEWDGLLAGVESGRYDIMVNGVGYTEERAEAYNFSKPYCYNKTALIVRSDNTEITSLSDLQGKTTCNSANSTYQLIAEQYGATVLDVETLDGTLEMVLAGSDRADATLNAEVSFLDYMTQHPDAELKIVAYADEVEQVCIIMPKTSTDELKSAIDQAIDELRADGTLAVLSEKYFGGNITDEQ